MQHETSQCSMVIKHVLSLCFYSIAILPFLCCISRSSISHAQKLVLSSDTDLQKHGLKHIPNTAVRTMCVMTHRPCWVFTSPPTVEKINCSIYIMASPAEPVLSDNFFVVTAISIILYRDLKEMSEHKHPYLDLQQEPITCCAKSHMIHATSCSLKKVLLLEGAKRKML